MTSPTEIHLAVGDILYREGDPNDCAFVISTGEVLLYYEVDGKRMPCERRCAGHIVGEVSILTDMPRSVTVEALTPCLIYRVSAEQILENFERIDPVLRACVDTAIDFVARFNVQSVAEPENVPMAPQTLRNADQLLSDFRFELDIKNGLALGEFFMVYQPVVSMADNSIVGVEALMRWQHPTLGGVPPDKFIAVAEQMRSIGQLSALALSQSCAALARLQMLAGPSFFASVNISGQDIDRPDFVDLVAHALDQHGIQPDTLRLEVTETALVPDSAVAERNLARIRALGCGISVDDFGTGYSNLAYLKSLPLTAIKIDRAFAADVNANPVSRGIVKMLLGLGNDLAVDVVAEGLEDADTAQELRALGCGFAQGYFYYRPMPEDALAALLSGGADAIGVA